MEIIIYTAIQSTVVTVLDIHKTPSEKPLFMECFKIVYKVDANEVST